MSDTTIRDQRAADRCDDTTEEITMTTPEPVDPIPADDAPHAYVAVRRTHSVNADRPEWERVAFVLPAHDTAELDHWHEHKPMFTFLPIRADGDTGTRAITERGDLTAKLAALRALATRWTNQPNPYQVDARTQRQVEDGRELLAILDGEEDRDGE